MADELPPLQIGFVNIPPAWVLVEPHRGIDILSIVRPIRFKFGDVLPVFTSEDKGAAFVAGHPGWQTRKISSRSALVNIAQRLQSCGVNYVCIDLTNLDSGDSPDVDSSSIAGFIAALGG